jgi:fucose 4-O-acetylase-like acetyltransferase
MTKSRPAVRSTVSVLTIGTLISVGLFVAGFVLRLVGQDAIADTAAIAAVMALLITPAAGLISTAVELRQQQLSAALLGLLVLAILVIATGLALLGMH